MIVRTGANEGTAFLDFVHAQLFSSFPRRNSNGLL